MSDEYNYSVNNNGCFLHSAEKPLANEELLSSFQPGIENFFENVEIYADANLSQEEVGFVQDSIQDAAQFISGLTGEYLGLPPLFKTIRIFYRPIFVTKESYKENEGKILEGGSEKNGDIVIAPFIHARCEDGELTYRTRLSYDPGIFIYISQLLAHELVHAYFFPRFHADPSMILEEGFATYAQFLFAADYGGTLNITAGKECMNGFSIIKNPISFRHEFFPKKPATPVAEMDIFEGAESEVFTPDGKVYNVKIEELDTGAGYVRFLFGSEEILLASGNYTLAKDHLVGISSFDGEFKLLVFTPENERKRVTSVKPPAEGKMYYTELGRLWGEDGFGRTAVFLEDKASGSGVISTYKFNQTDKTHGPAEYTAAFLMWTTLEELYWKVRASEPDFDPSNFYKEIGELHKDFRAYLFNDPAIVEAGGRYFTCETNVYHELCTAMALPESESLGIFQQFGLNVDHCDKDVGTNICVPKDDVENVEEGPERVEETAGGSSGCEINNDRGAAIDAAISNLLSEAAHEYASIFPMNRQIFDDGYGIFSF